MKTLLAVAALLPAAVPAAAAPQDPATDPKCMTVRMALPPELAGWSERTGVRASAGARLAPVLVVGRAADVMLGSAFMPAVAPEKAPAPGTYAGIAQFRIARAGTYRVALGGKAWIDVVRGRTPIASTAHTMGPMCTGVAKLVDFRLTPGRYFLQLSGAPSRQIAAMIVKVK